MKKLLTYVAFPILLVASGLTPTACINLYKNHDISYRQRNGTLVFRKVDGISCHTEVETAPNGLVRSVYRSSLGNFENYFDYDGDGKVDHFSLYLSSLLNREVPSSLYLWGDRHRKEYHQEFKEADREFQEQVERFKTMIERYINSYD